MAKHCVLAERSARQILKARVKALRAQIEPARAEVCDGIHDMRVASRRVRVAVSEHAFLFPQARRRRFQRRVRRITRALGKARELDVVIDVLQRLRKDFHGPPRYAVNHVVRRLRAERDQQSRNVARGLGDLDTHKFDRRLLRLFEALSPTQDCYVKHAARRLRRRYQNLADHYDVWRKSGAEPDLHALRIEYKKLRYACEVYAALYGKAMTAFIERLKDTQTALGDWNDLRVLRGYIEQAARDAPPRAREGMNGLLDAVDGRARGLLEQFACGARTFFAPAERKKTRRLFVKQEARCCQKGAMLDAH
ncbi:MAG TPA: CHAD domain-containing protein [Candidatus Hydrogenedentes bacterium]|nr:CHAD domain-containing protein [Candidatus Hydrogenedentota bacterium]